MKLIEFLSVKLFGLKIENKFVGIGALVMYNGFSFIGAMGVSPQFQKKGIGRKIFLKLLQVSHENNINNIGLFSTFSGEKLYRKLNFTDKNTFSITFMSLGLLDKEYRIEEIGIEIHKGNSVPNWIYELDRITLGYDLHILINFLLNKMDGILYFSNQEDGFVITTGNNIAICIASKKQTAISLLKYVVEKGFNKINIPDYNLEVLDEYFFVYHPQNRTRYMFLGDNTLINKKNLYSVYGPLTG
jgi:hypothetical protein